MKTNKPRSMPAPMRPVVTTRRGFTLIELSVVILIIGIILGFIVIAAMSSAEAARTRATQALIAKLELGLNERVQALTTTSPTVNGTHQFLAAVNPQGFPAGQLPLPWGLPSGQRAEVIARFDQMRMEIPDVFYIQNYTPGPNDYPINFAGLPYPLPNNVGPPQAPIAYALPLGHLIPPGFTPTGENPPVAQSPADIDPDGDGQPNVGPGAGMAPGTHLGIYGASNTARAALHKLIGFAPTGSDAADNNGNGLVDEFGECVPNPNDPTDPYTQAWVRFRDNHTHDTARAEMLYALLVEGAGPMGSVFGKEEFKEGIDYRDTDGDGLPEFVDAWGRPLQFYRWPIYYPSEGVQGGSAAYGNTFQPRENHPLDPNNQLTAPAWWLDLDGQAPDKSYLFQRYFTSLIDPNVGQAFTSGGNYWDRTGGTARRAFFCKFLIVSSGPDQKLGLYQLDNDFVRSLAGGQPDVIAAMLVGNPAPVNAPNDFSPSQFGENWAVMTYEPDEAPNMASYQAYNGYPLQRSLNQLEADYAGGQRTEPPGPPRAVTDNIDNLKLQATSGGVR